MAAAVWAEDLLSVLSKLRDGSLAENTWDWIKSDGGSVWRTGSWTQEREDGAYEDGRGGIERVEGFGVG